MQTIYIRPLQADDYPLWRPLWNAYLAFYQTSLPEATTQNTWHKLTHHAAVQGWGAFDGSGKMLGFVHTVCHPNTWNTTDCCYLEDLFVCPDARRQGIAKRLIETVYAFAEAEQLNRVYWVTDVRNETAQALYHQLAAQTDMVQFRKNF